MGEGDLRDYRSLGEILREAREKKGWTLEFLSERTRIAPRMIRSLEHDDLEQISSPVYARGFIRNLARELQLDPEWLLGKVDLGGDGTSAVPESVKRPSAGVAPPSTPKVAPTAPAPSERGPVWQVESVRVRRVEATPERRIPWRPILILVGLAVVVAAIVWSLPLLRGGEEPGGTEVGRVGPSDLPTSTLGREVDAPGATEEGPVPAAGSGEVAADAGEDADTPEESPGDTPEETAPSPPPAEERAEAEQTPDTASPTVEGEGADSSTEVVGNGAATRGLPSIVRPDPDRQRPLRLVIRARSRVEVVVAADARTAQQRVLRAGEAWSLEALDHFSLQASDPDAVELELDGVRRDPPAGWNGDELLLYPLPSGEGGGR